VNKKHKLYQLKNTIKIINDFQWNLKERQLAQEKEEFTKMKNKYLLRNARTFRIW
jgi:hypothetical protein